MDFQGMLGDLPQNAWYIRGFARKDVFVVAEEVDERAFLFGGEHGTNAYHFSSELLGSMRTSLAPSTGSKDPADHLELGASSATSFLMAVSSLEAMIAVACSSHS